jgi:hypothetical protein
VNELTELNTYAGLKVSTKDTKVKTNSAEMEIKLNEETFEHVPEHTWVGQLISTWDYTGTQSKIEMEWF